MKRTFLLGLAAFVLAFTASLPAQTSAPEIAFDTNADLLKTPPNAFLGEVAGVATNSRGNIFVYTRTGHPYATLGDSRTFYHAGSRLFEFTSSGAFVRELGQDLYGFNAAQGLRVDPQDNIWAIDAGSNQIIKFDSNGSVQLVLGRKPETIGVRPAAPRGGATAQAAPAVPASPAAAPAAPAATGAAQPAAGARGAALQAPVQTALARGGRGAGAGAQGSAFSRPTDVAWDRTGNIFIADGIGNNNRVAKFDKDGKFLKSWGQTGAENGQFNGVRSIALDAQGNVYVADAGNKRIQVFDGEGTFKSQITSIGTPQALCISRGATQYLYSAHSGDPDGMVDAAIYKIGLDGKVIGRFGSAGKLPKQFGLINSMDCRNENELLVGEMINWRIQKVTLRPAR
jgi:DNA-binding beta-propeller fold protein YncE